MRRGASSGNFFTRVGLCALASSVLLAGCGVKPQQNEDEPIGNFRVEVVEADFPTKQKLARRSTLKLAVKNVDSRAIPNINVAVKGLGGASTSTTTDFRDAEKSDPQDPQFVLNKGPAGGETAYLGTYALGNLDPGQTKVFNFDVTALQAGAYELRYQVQAGLDGKAKAVLADSGKPVTGQFNGVVQSDAPSARVADDGETIISEGERTGPENR